MQGRCRRHDSEDDAHIHRRFIFNQVAQTWLCRRMLALMTALFGVVAWTSSEAAPFSAYEIKTDMPSLKDNLRYADIQVRCCIGKR